MEDRELELLNLIAPEHSYYTCSDGDTCNYDRICTRCHLLAYLRGEDEAHEEYGLIIYKRKFHRDCPDCAGHLEP